MGIVKRKLKYLDNQTMTAAEINANWPSSVEEKTDLKSEINKARKKIRVVMSAVKLAAKKLDRNRIK